MKRILKMAALCLAAGLSAPQTGAQGIHFSQYYHSPMLLNPANTALMPDKDYRVGANYRSQWTDLPMPYTTASVYGDAQLLRNRSGGKSWLGLGFALYHDQVGNNDLSLMRGEAFVAYHGLLSEHFMLSGGASAAWCQRRLDFGRLRFDAQWDGNDYSTALPSGEPAGVVRTAYTDLSAGVNLAYFPGERAYLKLGLGVAHLNRPAETFYGNDYRLHMRPSANADLLVRTGDRVIVNPSVYYSGSGRAWELTYGALVHVRLSYDAARNRSAKLILGAFHRWNDAVVGVAGYELNEALRLFFSYDYTVSRLGQQVSGNHAMEAGLRFQGIYREASRYRASYSCPRFLEGEWFLK